MIRVDHGCEYHLVGNPSTWRPLQGTRLCRRPLRHGNAGAGILFAGPWIGEFGWELARWQGAVRKRAEETGLYTIVMSDPGHHVLYDDFAHAFWELPDVFLEADVIRQCDHVRARHAGVLKALGCIVRNELDYTGPVKDFLTPTKFKPEEQHVVPLSVSSDRWSAAASVFCQRLGYFCILPRFRAWNEHKNWPAENWRTLVSRLADVHLSAQVVGRADEIGKLIPMFEVPPRDELARSIDLLSHAKFAIAPESGGALLSLMCGCPTLVFGHHSQRARITETENFLGTKVKYLSRPDYDFSIDEVARGAIELMRTL